MAESSKTVRGRLKVVVVHVYNVPHYIAHHVFGEDCTPAHRMKAGGIVMIVGVLIAHTPAILPMGAFAILPDLVGYLIHGIGGYPFIEHLVSNVKAERSNGEKEEDSAT